MPGARRFACTPFLPCLSIWALMSLSARGTLLMRKASNVVLPGEQDLSDVRKGYDFELPSRYDWSQ
jgi:hypothetical protein